MEKRPEFTGPLVNSWPARLLTLKIARFSVIFWDPKKCRNHYFCSIISFAYTRPLKLAPKKEGPKTSPSTELYQKKTPHPGPFINSSFWRHQKIRGKITFSDCCVLLFWPIIFFFCFGFCSPPKNYPQIFSDSSGVAKNRKKTKVFFLRVSWHFFFGGGVFHVVSLCSCFSSCTFFVANV